MSFFIAPLIMLPSFLTVVLVAILFADIEIVLAVRCPDTGKLYFHIHIKRKQQFKKLTTNHRCMLDIWLIIRHLTETIIAPCKA